MPADPTTPGQTVINENAPWYKVLGVPGGATLDQIRKTYGEKSAAYHPDRAAGMSPEFHETAIRMTRRSNDAFEEGV